MESSLINEVIERLKNIGGTLALAESCTGGLLSAQFVRLSGVSQFYRGAVVSYDNRVKVNVLGISEPLLLTHGAVSRPVARAMAQSARRVLEATWACSITGVAGPSGGSKDKPVGTVCFGVSGPGFEETREAHFKGERSAVQDQSVEFALAFLREALAR